MASPQRSVMSVGEVAELFADSDSENDYFATDLSDNDDESYNSCSNDEPESQLASTSVTCSSVDSNNHNAEPNNIMQTETSQPLSPPDIVSIIFFEC